MKNNHIVFCVGPDMTGKTEISKALAEELGVPRYKATTEHQGFLKDQSRFVNDIRYSCPARLDLLKQIGCGIVYDRGYPCEYAYSEFFGRETDDDAIWWLDDQYAKLDAAIVVTQRSSYEGITDDLDPNINAKALQRLHDIYNNFAALSKCRILKLNVDDQDLYREVTEILKFLEAK